MVDFEREYNFYIENKRWPDISKLKCNIGNIIKLPLRIHVITSCHSFIYRRLNLLLRFALETYIYNYRSYEI